MAGAVKNLIWETSTTTGTGNKTLASFGGYQRVSAAFGTGDNGASNPYLFFANKDAASPEWEVVQGYMSDANTFVPVTVIKSSNSNAAVSFTSGTKYVTNDIPAEYQVNSSDLASTSSGKGASLIGIQDSAGIITGTNVETALAELAKGRDQLFQAVAFNSMILADVVNFAQFPSADRVADSFDDLTYVDVAGATNLSTATAGVLKPTTSAGTDQTATHTSATQSGNTVSESSFTTGYPGWQAFDKVTGGASGSGCWVSNGTATGWLQYQFGSAKVIGSYTVRSGNGYATRAPKDWTLKGSNDGTNWTVVDTVTSQTSWTAGGEQRSFTVDTPGSYTYYRLDITANNTDSYLQIDEVTLVSLTTNNLTVASAALPISIHPDVMFGQLLVKEVDSVTANTDFLLDFSRNNGTNWVTATLTLIRSIPITGGVTLKHYATNNVDMTGYTYSTATKYRIRTANNKNVEFHALYAYGT